MEAAAASSDIGLEIHDTEKALLEIYFGETEEKMQNIIASYQEQDSEDGVEMAVELLYRATNDDFSDFVEYLEECFPRQGQEDKDVLITYGYFEVFARRASGNILDADVLIEQLQRISDSKELKIKISQYFKKESNKFLTENHLESLTKLGFVGANDNVVEQDLDSESDEPLAKRNKIADPEKTSKPRSGPRSSSASSLDQDQLLVAQHKK